jgi:hypothetical protein
MVWWVTLLEWIGIIILVCLVATGIYTTIGFITNKLLKRRYKTEDDIGRNRKEFSRSITGGAEAEGIRMEQPNSERSILQDTVAAANEDADRYIREIRKDSTDDREESRPYGGDYDRFKKEVLGL